MRIIIAGAGEVSTKELYHLLKLDKEGLCESLLQVLAK